MKILNWVVAGLLICGLVYLMNRPVAPPQDEWFQRAVVSRNEPVLVKFGAEWCPPCRELEGVLDRLEPRLAGRVRIVRIDVDEKPELAAHYGVSGIPRLCLFEQGTVVGSRVGSTDVDTLESWIRQRVK